ncbi:hypothetical protein MG293_009850 [Ovis ammon polii]|uniref:AMOP domain-containing protein n=1 Tax=Ovis ammon polii TaxID=230172 RepID=A0AAD4U9X7_OVIAM|nr:hypothetical protein MG293_009850 [Ovis ammon polii]
MAPWDEQVTVEVVVDPQDELEMDLMAEPSNCWSEGAPRWLPAEELFWPLCWGYSEGEEERPHLKGRTSGEEQEEEEEDDPPEYSEGAKDKDPLGFPSERWQPLAHDAMDMVSPDVDSCEKWLNGKSDFLAKYLKPGAVGSAQLPMRVRVGGRVQRREPSGRFRTSIRDAASAGRMPAARASAWTCTVYRSTARFCLRSLQHAGSPALLLRREQPAADPGQGCRCARPGQHRRLTRASLQGGHAAPISCKADCSRYHAVRPANNGQACADNPPEEEYLAQLQEAKEY